MGFLKLAAASVLGGGGYMVWVRANERDLTGKVVVITGAGSGLGRLLSQKLAKQGCRVAVWDVMSKTADETAELIRTSGGTAKAYSCDVTNAAAVRDGAAAVLKDFGQVDILVNNAGIVSGKKLLEVPERLAQKTVDVNTTSHFWTVKSFLPGMLDRNSGHIVTVASAAGIVGVAGLADYCASKFGAVGFNESLRMELRKLGKHGVSTTCVCPYYINTGMFEGVKTRFPLLLPILEPEYVVDRIVTALKRNEARVITPRFVHLAGAARVLPPCLSDPIMEFFGINSTMDEFKQTRAN